MNTIFRLISLCLTSLALLIYAPFSNASIPSSNSLAPMLETMMPSVVNIKAQIKVTDFQMLRELQKQNKEEANENGMKNSLANTLVSIGSGVIVDSKNGYILTNSHVVADAQSVTVTLTDGRHYNAKTIGLDKPSDVALLQIKASNLTAAHIGDSSKLKVGDFVAAIGNPFGLSESVSSGIISALGRSTLGIENYENFIQTDAPINPGNSGGALINMNGELIGINTAILAPARGSIGIGFAIPANMAKSVMIQLIQYGNVRRGALGVGAQDITPELAAAFQLGNSKGSVITQVLPDSPAALAGLKTGDIITSVNGEPIKNASDVVNTIGFLRVDSKVAINVLRNHKPLSVETVVSDPKKRKEMLVKMDPFLHGVGLKDFSMTSPVHGNVIGVLLVSVEEDSSAWHSDLRPGDIIVSANQEKIDNISALKAVTAKAKESLLLNVIRGPSALFLLINKE